MCFFVFLIVRIFFICPVMALYKTIHPEYASYLYLMAPISLAILNPIGLILMEIDKIVKTKNEVVNKLSKLVENFI